MGVPVITLTGQSYASNMSSAVLHGAGLGHLCANNSNDYVRIALQLASNIQSLRHTRDHWRNCVINSQLGDTAGLMNHLESAFLLCTLVHCKLFLVHIPFSLCCINRFSILFFLFLCVSSFHASHPCKVLLLS